MYVIGLTGGIASGKTTAAETLRALGAEVIDADAISREVTAADGIAAPAILDRFGTLDRKALGAVVFSDVQARRDLNAIVHPLVRQEMLARMADSGAPVVVLDIPLLYETGMETMAHEVWVVHVPRDIQVQRVMARDHLTQAEAIARIDSQMPTEEKVRRADVAIDTSGTFLQTRRQLEAHWQEVLARIGVDPEGAQAAPPRRRHRSEARRAQQRELEAQVSEPKLSHTRPFEPPPRDAWEDTSTLLPVSEERTFFARQPPAFWVATGILLVALLTLLGIIGVNAWREAEAQRAEERRLQQLAEEKARYPLLYRDIIEANAYEQGVEPALVAAVVYNESRFDPEAISYLGARGLMQIMPDTGDWIAMRLNETGSYSFDRMFVPEDNVRYGVWFLGYLDRMFEGDIVKMAAGYHAGQYAVLDWLENPEYSSDGETLDVIPIKDTAQYVERVRSAYEIYKRHYYTEEGMEGTAGAAKAAVPAAGAAGVALWR